MATIFFNGWSKVNSQESRVCGTISEVPLKLFLYVYKYRPDLDINQFCPDPRAAEYPGAMSFDHDDVPTEANSGDVVVAGWAVDTSEAHSRYQSPIPCGSPSSSSSSSIASSSSSTAPSSSSSSSSSPSSPPIGSSSSS